MVAILKIEDGDIKRWVLATDIHDARRQVTYDDQELAAHLYRMDLYAAPGKHELPTGHIMLVS